MRRPPCCVFNADRKCVPLFYGGEATLIDSSCPFVVTAVIDQVDPLLAWGVSFLAVVIGAFRGRDYGQLIETTISDVTDWRGGSFRRFRSWLPRVMCCY